MKKTAMKAKKSRDTMRAEYDFSNAARGKYHRAVRENSNVVVLEPDIAARFRNSRAVNEALRAVLKAAEQTQA
ncbi:MAG TPA: hypothetical protein VHC92_03360 [Rhodanobacteraceae bacterium]|jgi:ABC-type tungstate transport system permease subunit|nr:hypothetical protein [Rhodanobacteraceae bacterium]